MEWTLRDRLPAPDESTYLMRSRVSSFCDGKIGTRKGSRERGIVVVEFVDVLSIPTFVGVVALRIDSGSLARDRPETDSIRRLVGSRLGAN